MNKILEKLKTYKVPLYSFKNEYILNKPLFKNYLNIYKELIEEDYNIFPVPGILLDDMTDFVLNSERIDKYYSLQDLLTEYMIDWKYYKQFQNNLKQMLKKNLNVTLTIVKFKNNSELLKIFKNYPTQNQVQIFLNRQFKATYYTYNDKFDVCILIRYIPNKELIRKRIQHELIHWMQYSLNTEVGTEYGLFEDIKFDLTKEDKKFLISCTNNRRILNYIDYMKNGLQFQPWCANTIQQFPNFQCTINEFKKIIENKELFKQKIYELSGYDDLIEVLLFVQLCYLTSLNKKNDDRYYYIIEALKEN